MKIKATGETERRSLKQQKQTFKLESLDSGMHWQWLARTSIRLREEMNWRFSWMLRSLCRSYSHRLSSWDYKHVCMGVCVYIHVCVLLDGTALTVNLTYTVMHYAQYISIKCVHVCMCVCGWMHVCVWVDACVCVGGCMCNLEHCRRLLWGVRGQQTTVVGKENPHVSTRVSMRGSRSTHLCLTLLLPHRLFLFWRHVTLLPIFIFLFRLALTFPFPRRWEFHCLFGNCTLGQHLIGGANAASHICDHM